MMEEELEWDAQLVLEMENGCTDAESEKEGWEDRQEEQEWCIWEGEGLDREP